MVGLGRVILALTILLLTGCATAPLVPLSWSADSGGWRFDGNSIRSPGPATSTSA